MKKLNEFINGTFLNKLNKQYDNIGLDGYDKKHHAYLTITQFEKLDSMNSQRNRVGSTLQLVNRKIEVDAVRLQKTKWGSFEIYVHSPAKNNHGFGSEGKVLVKYKLPGDKKQREIILYKSWDREDFKTNYDFDSVVECIMNQDLSDKYKNQIRNNWSLKRYVASVYKKEITDYLYYSMMSDLERDYIDSRTKEYLEKFGIEIKVVFPFNHSFRVCNSSIEYLEHSKDELSFEIGYKNTSTYCSLPEMIKLEIRKSESSVVMLKDIGMEGSGYYSHSDRMSVKKEDLDKVIKFKKRFKRKSKW